MGILIVTVTELEVSVSLIFVVARCIIVDLFILCES